MKSSSALQMLKEARSASRSGTHPTAAAQHSAAASEADNEAYMQEFNQAFQHLTAGKTASKQPELHSKQQGHPQLQSRAPAQGVGPSTAAKHDHASSRSSSISAARNPYADQDSTGASLHPVAPGWHTGPTDEAGMQACSSCSSFAALVALHTGYMLPDIFTASPSSSVCHHSNSGPQYLACASSRCIIHANGLLTAGSGGNEMQVCWCSCQTGRCCAVLR